VTPVLARPDRIDHQERQMTTQPTGQLPKWLKPANRVIMFLQKVGLPIGTMHVIAVPGRKSGTLRATPVSPLTVDHQRYVIAGKSDSDWAKNVRAAGWGNLSRGRRTTRVGLQEVEDHDLKVRVMRAFPVEVPHGVAFFVKLGLVSGPSPDEFEAAADHAAVFHIVHGD
jgi:hypothetical protein